MKSPDTPTLITAQDAADILGLSVRTLFTYAENGDLPRVRVGARAVRYDLADVRKFIERRKTRARRSR